MKNNFYQSVKQDHKTGRWYCEVCVFGQRKHRACKGCRTEYEAKEFASDLAYELSLIYRGKIADTKVITVKEMFDNYLKYSKANKKTVTKDEQIVPILRAFFDDKKTISDITPSRIEDLKIFLTKKRKLSGATFNRYYAALSKSFSLIIDEKDLNIQNPCKKVKKLPEGNQKTRYLTKEEERRLFNELAEHLRPIAVCALSTGLRISNVLNLKWESIDFEQNFIEILKQENKGHKKIQLPLSSKLKFELEKIGIKTTGFVFINPETNKPYTNIYKGFNKACERANVPNFTPHDMRHTVATRLIANGADLKTVKEVLAHSQISTTQRYMHATPENMQKAIDILDGF